MTTRGSKSEARAPRALTPAGLDARGRAIALDRNFTGLRHARELAENRWRLNPDDIDRMAAFELELLESAATLVRRGGAIVYVVRSAAPLEGKGVVDRFVASHRDSSIDRNLPMRKMLGDILDADGCLATRPDRGGLDGFFAARLIRN